MVADVEFQFDKLLKRLFFSVLNHKLKILKLNELKSIRKDIGNINSDCEKKT